jgi:hypothetical protein
MSGESRWKLTIGLASAGGVDESFFAAKQAVPGAGAT